jgi:predicted nucleic acid-binding protein
MTGKHLSSDLSFVDTNVLVHAFDKLPSPKKQVAQRLVAELVEQKRLKVSTQILQELFVTLTQPSQLTGPFD